MKTASGQEWSAAESIKCAICDQDDSTLLFEARDFIYGNEGTFPLVRCRTCGLVYLNPRPIPDEAPKFYPPSYFSFRPASIPTPSRTSYARFKRQLKAIVLEEALAYPGTEDVASSVLCHPLVKSPLARLLARYVEANNIPPFLGNHRILDVGCGNGSFLLQMKNLGWRTYGVELNPSVATYSQKSLGVNIVGATLLEAGFDRSFFDVVTFWDSLEHLPNPVEVLREVGRILSPTGLLIISAPNFGCLLRKIFQERWFNVAAPLHYYHYTRASLNALLEKVGFYVEKVRYPLGTAGLSESMEITLLGRIQHNGALAKALMRKLFYVPHRLWPRGHLVVYAKRQMSEAKSV